MEYGWSRVSDALYTRSVTDNDATRELDRTDTLSVRSGRSNRSKFGWRDATQTLRASHSPWTDRVSINDWKPPIPPSISSINDEETQLEALQKYVGTLKRDLKRHNELREPMVALVRRLCSLAFVYSRFHFSVSPPICKLHKST